MKTLFIDTHLNDLRIILLEDGILVDKRELINKKNNSEYLFPLIKDLIEDKVIEEIIVVNGPGSFTGVRLGVTIAKTLAYTLNIPIKTITSLEVLAISNKTKYVAISDGNGYYLGICDDNYNLKESKYVNNSEFININDNNLYITENLLDIESVYSYCINRDHINPHLVNPIYIKKIGVELDKKSN